MDKVKIYINSYFRYYDSDSNIYDAILEMYNLCDNLLFFGFVSDSERNELREYVFKTARHFDYSISKEMVE